MKIGKSWRHRWANDNPRPKPPELIPGLPGVNAQRMLAYREQLVGWLVGKAEAIMYGLEWSLRLGIISSRNAALRLPRTARTSRVVITMHEIWKTVDKFSWYQISSFGRVRVCAKNKK